MSRCVIAANLRSLRMATIINIDDYRRLHSLRKRIRKGDDAIVQQFKLIVKFPKNSTERALAVSLLRVTLETHAELEAFEKKLTSDGHPMNRAINAEC
jgi:hypothetical protein